MCDLWIKHYLFSCFKHKENPENVTGLSEDMEFDVAG